MANERLRDAMMKAGQTPVTLSDTLQVDPKTIERWITKGRVPYQRHRAKLATTLGISENYLWPDALTEERKALVSQSEVVELFPRRCMAPINLWGRLLDEAKDFIGILAYAGLFLPEQDPRLIPALKAKAGAGAKIVILLGDPDCPQVATRGAEEGIGDALASKIRNVLTFYRPLQDVPGITVAFHRTTLYNSIYWYDDQMLVNTHILGFPAAHAPMLHLRRLSGGTLFDTYADNFDRIRMTSESAWPKIVAQ